MNGTQFFKILLPGFLDRLHIPRDFMKNVTSEKLNIASIRGPLGKSWQVKVHQNTNGWYFEDGWRDFAVVHNLSVGFLLVFKYEGNMEFDVTIFDHSACEKEYDPSSVESTIVISGPSEQTAEKPNIMTYLNKQLAITESKLKKVYGTRSCCSLGPHFTVTIKDCNLTTKSYMNIPMSFKASYNISKRPQLILRDPGGQLWPVSLCHRRKRFGTQTKFGSGWREFGIYNDLKVGDRCIFEIRQEEEIDMMHVHIFRK